MIFYMPCIAYINPYFRAPSPLKPLKNQKNQIIFQKKQTKTIEKQMSKKGLGDKTGLKQVPSGPNEL